MAFATDHALLTLPLPLQLQLPLQLPLLGLKRCLVLSPAE